MSKQKFLNSNPNLISHHNYRKLYFQENYSRNILNESYEHKIRKLSVSRKTSAQHPEPMKNYPTARKSINIQSTETKSFCPSRGSPGSWHNPFHNSMSVPVPNICTIYRRFSIFHHILSLGTTKRWCKANGCFFLYFRPDVSEGLAGSY